MPPIGEHVDTPRREPLVAATMGASAWGEPSHAVVANDLHYYPCIPCATKYLYHQVSALEKKRKIKLINLHHLLNDPINVEGGEAGAKGENIWYIPEQKYETVM